MCYICTVVEWLSSYTLKFCELISARSYFYVHDHDVVSYADYSVGNKCNATLVKVCYIHIMQNSVMS